MANKPVNTSSGQSGSFDKGLNEDIDGFARQPNQWSQARNAVNNTTFGDVGELSNEASNVLCAMAPYTIIGLIHLTADSWAVFSTNDVDSEIGIFKEDSCTYKTVVNDPCLAFNKDNLIKGVSRTAYDCQNRVYWDDGVNPSRVMDMDDVPWVQDCTLEGDCQICVDTDVLDCDKIRLAPPIKDLSFTVKQGTNSGDIINGSYFVVGAYLVDGVRISDYSLPSNVQPLFRHLNTSSSLEIIVDEVDENYEEFEVILIQFANFNTVGKRLGVYSTRQKKITLDRISERLANVDPGQILLNNPIIDRSDAIFKNGKYLLRTGPTNKFDFNYQPLANQIETRWVSVEYDADYYKDGGSNPGYMRDEVYPYFVRWVFDTGDKSPSFHIPGRRATTADKGIVGNPDDIVPGDEAIQWKVYNTATVDGAFPTTGDVLDDGGVILGGGKMGYWESTEVYDDDKPQIWNSSYDPNLSGTSDIRYDLCGKPIRHHKFPDNGTDTSSNMITNHYDPNNGSKIRIMSVQFSNIKQPVDNEGNPITNICGYEILRGSREGNRTVLAKGMINNMRSYVTIDNLNGDSAKEFLYPNYPYNPTAGTPSGWDNSGRQVDRFLSSTHTSYKGPGLLESAEDALNSNNAYLQNDIPLGLDGTQFQGYTNLKKDLLTFHSPETNFRDPFLSAKNIKVYGELHGDMVGQFAFPKDHPRHKIIGNTAFLVSALIGIGYAMVSMEGEKKVKYTSPRIDYGGTYAQVGVSTGTTGVAGPSAVAAAIMSGSTAGAQVSETIVNETLSNSLLSLGQSIIGIDPNIARDTALNSGGNIAGSIGGVGGSQEVERTITPWGATPDILRAIQGIPAFLTFWGEGVDKMLALIYSFTPYRQFALQQVSHCFYNKFAVSDLGNKRREILNQRYIAPEFQEFANDYRINNLYRSRTVALKIGKDLDFPYKQIDDTQQLFSDIWGRDNDVPGFPSGTNPWDRDELINSEFNKPASSHYVALKQDLSNQYGQLPSIIQVPVSTDQHSIVDAGTNLQIPVNVSPVLFSGDTYIGRYTEKNTMHFFYDWLKGQPDGAEFDYKLRKNVVHPRFWLDTDPFDVNEFLQSIGTIFDGDDGAPSSFDPFMLDPDSASTTCNCSNFSGCLFSQNDLDEICELEEEITQQELYIDFLEACACFRDDGDDGCGGDDPVGTTPFSTDCTGTYDPYELGACEECPDWNNADDYIDEGKKKWARKIKRVERNLKRTKKKRDKKVDSLYQDYLDSLSGDDQNFIDKIFDGIVTPSDKYALDMQKPRRFAFNVKKAFFYLFNSGVRDFFVESEVNVDLRDWGDLPEQRHYDRRDYTDLRELFSTDIIKVGNYMRYDYSLSISKLFTSFVSWSALQERTYDPEVAASCFTYRAKRVVYSLPQQSESKQDSWRLFLPNNYKDFSSVTTAIKPLGKSSAIFLFETESPAILPGVDELQTSSGTKITIGDGGLFSREVQNLVNADYPHEYGSCQNRLAVANTPSGIYYMSTNQGKIFHATGNGLNEISNIGLKWWFAKYLPYQLTNHPAFIDPTTGDKRLFELDDNPVNGIGCQVIYDNENQIVFFTKKDWFIRTDIADTVTYKSDSTFLVNGIAEVQLGDPAYFRPASWTMSFDPKTQNWISYHDWHPDLALPTNNTFITTKDNGVWVHADTCESYCNFYGVDYPFEVEFELHTSGQVNTLRNIMYLMEAYVYPNDNCNDRFHVLDFNFDEAILYNSEQCSGLLRLNLAPKNNAPEILTYPRINFNSIDILYHKEEHKYRFNQFWDITDDRGEFNAAAQRTIFFTEPNGYIKNLNAGNLNYNKFALERKKFRHYKNTVLLRRRVSGNKNIVISVASLMNLTSPR